METHIIPSENPWNGWIEVYDERGNLYYSTFSVGEYLHFLEHLQEDLECLKYVAESMGEELFEFAKWISVQIAEIHLEWLERIGEI
jgi:hypothetical protein